VDLFLDQSKVQFGVNGSLIIEPNVQFGGQCSQLSGCNNKWQGVTIKKSALVRLSQVTFRDALTALNYVDGYIAPPAKKNFIVKSTFKNCATGIVIGDGLIKIASGATLTFEKFDANIFESSKVSLFTDMVGINVGHKSIAIIGTGSKFSLPNKFVSLTRGITIGRAANVRVLHCRFEKIRYSGIAASSGTSLIVGGTSLNNSCYFSDIGEYGVCAENSEGFFSVINSTFSRIKTAIYQTGAIGNAKILIQKCQISDSGTGISLTRKENLAFQPSSLNLVYLNTITNFTAYGIYMYGTAVAKDKFIISSNTISSEVNFKSGIQVGVDQEGLLLEGNKVTNTNPIPPCGTCISTSFGISVIGSSSSENARITIRDNHVSTVAANAIKAYIPTENSYSGIQCGFHIQSSRGLVVQNNTATNCFRDFHIDSDCSNMHFACNKMFTSPFGLACIPFAINPNERMGAQNPFGLSNGNIWDINSTFYYAAFAGSPKGAPISSPGTIFYVDDNTGNKPPSIAGPSGWFQESPKYDSTACSSILPSALPPFVISSYEDSLIINEIPNVGWAEKVSLYEKLRTIDPTNLSPDLSRWLNLPEQESVRNVYEPFISANSASGIDQYLVADLETHLAAYLKANDELDEALQNEGTVQAEQAIITLSKMHSSFMDSASSLTQKRKEQVEKAITLIKNVNLNGEAENITKIMLSSKLTLFAGSKIEDTQLKELYEIATPCLGVATYTDKNEAAEILYQLGMIDHVRRESEWFACSSEREPITKSVIAISVSPNPCTGELTVSSSEDVDTFHIFDTFGRLIFTTQQNKIDLTGNPSGVYQVKLYKNAEVVGFTKILKL
jgi:Right handed beta helix region/Secretion system C-terminal sorting domain